MALKTIFFIICLSVLLYVPLDVVKSDPFNEDGAPALEDTPPKSGAVSAAVVTVIGWGATALAYVLGYITTLILDVLTKVASYNKIINVETVKTGWKIVRDLCNMFFILILLLISFATILRVESYNMKKWLPKLLIMAVLINFSRTICGLIIDFAQVIMMTFVNGFGSNPTGKFVDMFRMDRYMKFDDLQNQFGKTDTNDLLWSTLLGIAAGVIALAITMVVLVVLLAILVMRIVMLWVYVILSPIAFLCMAFPHGQKYASQWWGDFSKTVITGPVLAFFMWLALTTAQTSADAMKDSIYLKDDIGKRINTEGQKAGVSAGTDLFESGNFQTYIITISLLIGGLIVTQQVGGMAAGMAGRGMTAIQGGRRLAQRTALGAGRGMADIGLNRVSGSDRVRNTLGAIGGSNIPLVGNIATRTLTGLDNRKKRHDENAQKYVDNISDTRILRRMANQSGWTPWRAAIKSAAMAKAPSLVNDATVRQDNYGKLTREQAQKLSKNELRRLGAQQSSRGIVLNGNNDFVDYVQTNRVARGAVNSGMAAPAYFGLDKDGNPHPSTAGSAGPAHAAPRNPHSYRKVDESEKSKPRGEGNLSVGEQFAKGDSNTIAVDFDKLGLEGLKEDINEEFKDTKGVNVTDSGTIKQVADKMVALINDELERLKSSPDVKKGDANRIQNLENARERFKQPDKLEYLNLANSSSSGYTAKDLVHTKVHEELHGYGVKNEEDAEALTQQIIDNRTYSQTKKIAEDHLAGKNTVDGGVTKEKEHPADKDLSDDEYGAPLSQTEESSVKETKKIINNYYSSNSGYTSAPKINDLSFALLRLVKALTEQSSSFSKLGKNLHEVSGGIDKRSTPLEVEVAASEIQKSIK